VLSDVTRHMALWLRAAHLAAYPLALLFQKTARAGCATSVHCAVSSELDGVSGEYFVHNAPAPRGAAAGDARAAARLWELSETLVANAHARAAAR